MKVHMNGMLRVGWTREEIIEVIIQLSVYVGFPTTIDALRVAGEVFAEADAG
jgi:4-carboxymuconolactone decarboxylase